jgi:purine nucleoside phosphorylase
LLDALDAAGTEAIREGVYWQTPGPRLETPAEVWGAGWGLIAAARPTSSA